MHEQAPAQKHAKAAGTSLFRPRQANAVMMPGAETFHLGFMSMSRGRFPKLVEWRISAFTISNKCHGSLGIRISLS